MTFLDTGEMRWGKMRQPQRKLEAHHAEHDDGLEGSDPSYQTGAPENPIPADAKAWNVLPRS